MADKIKLTVALALVALGIAGYYLLAASSPVLRVVAVVAGVLAGGVIAWFSGPGQQFAVFAREAYAELRKVVWPTRKETTQTAAAVFAFVVVMALFLYLSDKTLEWALYDLILGWKK